MRCFRGESSETAERFLENQLKIVLSGVDTRLDLPFR